jgi:hypothetical protein
MSKLLLRPGRVLKIAIYKERGAGGYRAPLE